MRNQEIHNLFESGTLIFALIIAIITLLTIALYLLLLTLFKRKQKIRREIIKKRYREIINRSLFKFLFQNEAGSVIPEKIGTGNFSSSSLFQKVAIKSLVVLHQNYSGEYKDKLELFYTHSGLVEYSLRKLNSRKWEHKVEAIRDLSNLRYMPAINQIRECMNHPNEMVQLEALSGMIKLKGLEEMLLLNKKVYLNDWVQSNILFQIKTAHIKEPGSLGDMLQSTNPSLQLMAVRLIDHFNSPRYSAQLQQLRKATGDPILINEIDTTVSRLQTFYKNLL